MARTTATSRRRSRARATSRETSASAHPQAWRARARPRRGSAGRPDTRRMRYPASGESSLNRRKRERVASGRSSPHPGRKRQKRPGYGRTRSLSPCRNATPVEPRSITAAPPRASGPTGQVPTRSRRASSLLRREGSPHRLGRHALSLSKAPHAVAPSRRRRVRPSAECRIRSRRSESGLRKLVRA